MGGCKSYQYGYDESTARYLKPEMTGFVTPTAADLHVFETRISHVENFPNTLTFGDIQNVNNSGTIEYFKNYTVAQAVKKHNADVIIAPVFDIKTSEDLLSIMVTVYGYPANYVNFRKATTEDLNLVYPCPKESTILIEKL